MARRAATTSATKLSDLSSYLTITSGALPAFGALVAEPIGDPHPQHLAVEPRHAGKVSGEQVDVTELARMKAGERRRGAGDRWAGVAGALVLAQLDPGPVGILEVEGILVAVMLDAEAGQMGGGVVKRDAARQLVAGVVVARGIGLGELERVGLIIAGQVRAPATPLALGQAELDRPAPGGGVEVVDP